MMSTTSNSLSAPARYGLAVAACLILALQAGASRMLKIDESKIGIPQLHDIPLQVDRWKSSGEEYMPPETAAYLKPDEYIMRDYVDEASGSDVNLFVAYFKSLQNTYGPHSPKICLPGSGWLVSSSKIVNMDVPGRPGGIPVNEFTMEQGSQRIFVLYWYQNDRDIWAEEFHAKLRLLPDLIRYRRSDVSLVRFVTPMRSSEPGEELKNCRQFSQRVFPMLAAHFASVSSGG
jgi:EpsI family protein